MSIVLEPRKVDRPFAFRWLRMTGELLVRSPVRFCLVIALLGGLDDFALSLAQGYAIRRIWIDRLAIVVLPVLWIVIGAVARGADDAGRTRQALAGLARKQLWAGALVPGASLAVLHWIVFRMFQHLDLALNSGAPGPFLQRPGEFLESIAMNIVSVSIWVGACYFPLLALVPDVSAEDARRLSKKASSINGELVIWIFIGTLVVGASVLVALVPACGMTAAAFIVFMGILNYVAYRDIFEQRAENIPKTIARGRIGPPSRAVARASPPPSAARHGA
jgi:hypothetical protein